ncbi:MAG: anti-sigma factor family protein [Acidimicrobiales bacterium]|jgi:anti-sigma factor RsiW
MRLPTLRRDIECQQAVELVTGYLEGTLSRREARRFEAHLRACDGCEEYLRQVKATIAVLGSVQPDDLAPETLQGLLELYRQFRGE